MGLALYHLGSAALGCDMIRPGSPPREFRETREPLSEKYLWAESYARSGQVLLEQAVEMDQQDQVRDRGPEVKEYCRMVKAWLTEKQEGAINQGLIPPFIVSGLDPPMAVV